MIRPIISFKVLLHKSYSSMKLVQVKVILCNSNLYGYAPHNYFGAVYPASFYRCCGGLSAGTSLEVLDELHKPSTIEWCGVIDVILTISP